MSKEKSTIHILMTGGTIGADPYADPKNPPINATFNTVGQEGGNIRRAIDSLISPEGGYHANNECTFVYKSICNEDSKALSNSEEYLGNIVSYINAQKDPNARFLVTCGTDAMVEIGKELSRNLKGKRVIITGAMMPLSNGPASDGHNNLRDSIEELSKEKGRVGVGICMGGEKFNPNAYVKDFEEQRFLPKHGQGNWADMIPKVNRQRSEHEMPPLKRELSIGDGSFKGDGFSWRFRTLTDLERSNSNMSR